MRSRRVQEIGGSSSVIVCTAIKRKIATNETVDLYKCHDRLWLRHISIRTISPVVDFWNEPLEGCMAYLTWSWYDIHNVNHKVVNNRTDKFRCCTSTVNFLPAIKAQRTRAVQKGDHEGY